MHGSELEAQINHSCLGVVHLMTVRRRGVRSRRATWHLGWYFKIYYGFLAFICTILMLMKKTQMTCY